MSSPVDSVRQRLAGGARLAVLTGAGISAESGVPTFRGGPESLWENHRPEQLATPEAFRRDPRLVWRWYLWRRGIIAGCHPNAGHLALNPLAARAKSFTLITQNVDGLHARAGTADPIELHGNIWKARCVRCALIVDDHRLEIETLPPTCPHCGSPQRPHIVWFGEHLDAEDLDRAVEAAREAEVFLVIGTSGVVQPAASLASLAHAQGAFVVEINPDETPLSGVVDVQLRGPAGVILPQLL